MSESTEFDALTAEFYHIWFRYHPVAAIYAGVPGFEGLMSSDGDDDIGALSHLLSNLLISLKEFDFDALDPDRQLDLQLIYGAVMIEHRILLEHDWRHRDPAKYLPLRVLQELVVRQPERFCDALIGILEKTPNYMRDARGRLAELPGLVSTLWLADALELVERGLPWLKRLDRDLPQTRECCADLGRLQSLASQAAEAIEDYQAYLINDLTPYASGTADCGRQLLDWLLKHRDQLDLKTEDAQAYARKCLQQVRNDLEQQGVTLQQLQSGAGERVSGDYRLQAYRRESAKLRAFLEAENLLPLVEQPLEFRVTDNCFLQPDCGSYLRSEEGGVFLVPHDNQVGGGESLSAIRMRIIYGAWAGRHYLTWAGGVAAHSLVRQINPSAAFSRGWAHYMRRLLEERGYFDEEDRLLLSKRHLALAEQAMVDLEFHAGEINSLQALERLKILSESPYWAEVSLTAISRRPTDAFMALLGADLIGRLAQRIGQQQPEISLLVFHERLLATGPVALPLVVQRAFGVDEWRSTFLEVMA
jgi:hypothetical protein